MAGKPGADMIDLLNELLRGIRGSESHRAPGQALQATSRFSKIQRSEAPLLHSSLYQENLGCSVANTCGKISPM